MEVVGDLEGDGLLDTVTTIWCGVFKDINTGQKWKFKPDQMEEMCEFLSKCTVVIGHNFIDYDVPALKKVLGFEFPKGTLIVDTYILSQMIEPDRRKHPACSGRKGAHSLENFGCIFKRPKPEHEDWATFSPEMLHRCSEDVEINFLLYKMLMREAKAKVHSDIHPLDPQSIWYKPYKLEAAFAECLVKQKIRGVLVDRDLILKHINTLTEKIEDIDREVVPQLPKRIIIKEQKKDGVLSWNKKPFKGNGDLNERTIDWVRANLDGNYRAIGGPFSRISIEDFDLGSIQQVKDYLLSEGWVPEQWNTKKDPITGVEKRTSPKLSKDDPFLGVKSDVGQKVAERMIYRHRRSQLEGFLKIIREDGRITANVTGITPTVRLKHGGIVNIPGEDSVFGLEMREVFIASPGYKFVGCDAASCQLRNLCHHMGDDEYTDAVINGNKDDGTDIHSVNMRKTGITVRKIAKNFIYGFLFGAGNPKIGAILGQDAEAAKKVRQKFLRELPGLKALLDRVESEFNQFGYITGLDGRPIFPRSKHECLCYLLQSDEAIMMKVATCYAHKWVEQRGLDAHMIIHMHDEYQWEAKEGQEKEVAELLETAIVKAGQFLKMNVPMAGEAAIGDNWRETH